MKTYSPLQLTWKGEEKTWTVTFQSYPTPAIISSFIGGEPSFNEFMAVAAGLPSCSPTMLHSLWVVVQCEYERSLDD